MAHVNKVSHVFTISHVAEMLGEDEDWLFEVAEEMDTEDGQLWVVGVGEDGVMAFTADGIDNLKDLIAIHKDDPTVHATVMRHHSMIIPQGAVIPAVLETPINSSMPGLVRAITSKDTRGFDGALVLIPKGSRLFGEYQSDAKAGQSRVMVNWSNLVRPDGVSIRLNSPAGDRSGGTGIPGKVNDHFLARFTSAVLQSALTVGPYLAYQPAAGSVLVNAPITTAATPATTLIPTAQAAPTITVKEGADIAVVVAHDLDFSGALPRQ